MIFSIFGVDNFWIENLNEEYYTSRVWMKEARLDLLISESEMAEDPKTRSRTYLERNLTLQQT